MKTNRRIRPGVWAALTAIACAWFLLIPFNLQATESARIIPLTLGDYRFMPDRISVDVGETVQLELANHDGVTPHNFTLRAKDAGLDIDIDVGAGKTRTVEITPLVTGTYRFFCSKKLPFMKSHRDRGMQGTLIVIPAGQH